MTHSTTSSGVGAFLPEFECGLVATICKLGVRRNTRSALRRPSFGSITLPFAPEWRNVLRLIAPYLTLPALLASSMRFSA